MKLSTASVVAKAFDPVKLVGKIEQNGSTLP